MQLEIDILENEIIEKLGGVLEILLSDRTTGKNIFWATDNYEHLGEGYRFNDNISLESITGKNGNIIMPRVHKVKTVQKSRVKEMAEVFTPSWLCNMQANGVDKYWFEREDVFNTAPSLKIWVTTTEKITFPEGKTWEDYVKRTCLEITCGEAPYLVSRYDTTTGEFIQLENRIGILDRKLRIINENVTEKDEWFDWVKIAYKNTLGYEWQGDSLLLAREALLITFIEHYIHRFEAESSIDEINEIAHIISWNIWQMDGLKSVVPNSCKDEIKESTDLFSTKTEIVKCPGCKKQNMFLHNGIYCKIMDWEDIHPETNEKGVVVQFTDLMGK